MPLSGGRISSRTACTTPDGTRRTAEASKLRQANGAQKAKKKKAHSRALTHTRICETEKRVDSSSSRTVRLCQPNETACCVTCERPI